MHSDVLYRCVFSRCVVMYRHVSRLHAWCLHVLSIQYMWLYRRFSILNDTGVVHVSDVSRVIRRYLSGISARLDVSCLRGVSAAGTYLPYTYPTRLLPLLLHTTPTTDPY